MSILLSENQSCERYIIEDVLFSRRDDRIREAMKVSQEQAQSTQSIYVTITQDMKLDCLIIVFMVRILRLLKTTGIEILTVIKF